MNDDRGNDWPDGSPVPERMMPPTEPFTWRGGGDFDRRVRSPSHGDPVNHPPHYTYAGVECIEVIEALGLGYHLGNAMKYLWRAGHKYEGVEGELADLEKAMWYIHRRVETLRREHAEDAGDAGDAGQEETEQAG